MSSRVAIVCLLALGAAACDRQSAPPAQDNAAAAANAAVAGSATTTPSPDEVTAPAAPAAAKTGVDRSHAGTPAPATAFAGPDGKPISLAAFRGKPVLVNLWATWCGPCVKELPTLDAVARALAGKVAVAAISQDARDTAKVPGFLKDHGAPTLAPYLDKDMALSLGFGASLPTTILYGSDGREVWRWNGENDWSTPAARALVGEAK